MGRRSARWLGHVARMGPKRLARQILSVVTLDRGAITLGAPSLVGILFADDVGLLARCVSDL